MSLDSIEARLALARECHEAGRDDLALVELVQAWDDIVSEAVAVERLDVGDVMRCDRWLALRALQSSAYHLATKGMRATIHQAQERERR